MSLALTSRRAALLPGRWVSNELWRRARAVPSLDLRFAENKSLVDSVSGQNLITFTRASTGTYVDSDGVIRSAATNLLLRSEEFDDAYWTKTGAITANSAVSPAGTLTADTLAAGTSNLISRQFVVTAGVPYTFSVWMKSATAGQPATLRLSLSNPQPVPDASVSVTTSDAWQRFSVTVASATTVNLVAQIGNWGTNGWGPSTAVDVWGAQLELGSTATAYLPTGATINSAPRFDHNPLTGECLGLLVEEQRQNLVANSQSILTTSGYGAVVSTLTNTAASTPISGLATASLCALNVGADTGNSSAGMNYGNTVLANTTVYTQSAFIKLSGATVFRLRSNASGQVFNITPSSGAPAPSGSITACAVQRFPDDWFRISWTFTTTSSAPGNRADHWTLKSDVADGTSGFLITGAQLEAGAFPTSYIPTTGTAATRTADVASISGTNFSSWYRQDEGTVLTSGTVPPGLSNFPTLNNFSDGSANNNWSQYLHTTGFYGNVRTGNVSQGDPGLLTAPVVGSVYRIALALRQDDAMTVANGALGAADTLLTMPTVLTDLRIGANRTGSAVINSTLRRLTYFPQRLPNSTLQSITL